MENEGVLRLMIFVAIAILVGTAERWFPRRTLNPSNRSRWITNLGLVAINTLVVRFVFPTAAVGFAWQVEQLGWGFLHAVELPFWLAFLLGAVALDFVIYLQHILFHAVPAFWRLHMVHHSDLDFDFTTGVRFHPLEILLSMGIKFATIAALGPPVLAVLFFEVMLNASSMFNHSNIRLAPKLDRVLRRVIVTPDMHRVHHSWVRSETNSNYGFNLSCWDRLFGTYQPQPAASHEHMTIGLENLRDPTKLTLRRLLSLPWRSQTVNNHINYNS